MMDAATCDRTPSEFHIVSTGCKPSGNAGLDAGGSRKVCWALMSRADLKSWK